MIWFKSRHTFKVYLFIFKQSVTFVLDMNNPFDYRPGRECEEAFRELSRQIDALKASDRPEDINFCREMESGKMLGVLIALDCSGERHTLYAFSGQLGHGGFYRNGFVEPVFDYLQPDGYFKIHEAEISRQNAAISQFEKDELADIRRMYDEAKERLDRELADFKEKCRQSKISRDARRESGELSEEEIAEMIRQSQFEKAELHRLKKKLAAQLEPYTTRLKRTEARLEELKERRKADSESLQDWLFTNFKVLNARGESQSLRDIFADTVMKIPPSGAGECCAPKLLQAAYRRGWHPVAMAEYWYGRPNGGEVRKHGEYYPACRGKCRPVLNWMLQGLEVTPPLESTLHKEVSHNPEILFENQWFCVVDKPSGMLSTPGKGSDISVQHWLEEHYGAARMVKVAHRLDQDTSGLLIATFGNEAFKLMQSLFATRKVAKTYVAVLEGDYTQWSHPSKGIIELPLSPDWLDRPRQRVDKDNGKDAVTEYEFTECRDGQSRVTFHPLTGRTHQLRVHSASHLGLGMPIVGDPLYSTKRDNRERLHLHAQKIEFTFPLNGKQYSFESPLPF